MSRAGHGRPPVAARRVGAAAYAVRGEERRLAHPLRDEVRRQHEVRAQRLLGGVRVARRARVEDPLVLAPPAFTPG